MNITERIIIALDVHKLEDVKKIVNSLGPEALFYKVGLELYCALGQDVIHYLKDQHKKIFLDLKFHDIPNTVGRALEVVLDAGVDIVNVHASGGHQMLQAANQVVVEFRQCKKKQIYLIAVTILTSLSERDIVTDLGVSRSMKEQVLALANMVQTCGLDGVVASGQEALEIRKALSDKFLIVVPGIRLPEDGKNDQSRVMTPQDAFKNGASHIVIGRSLTASHEPQKKYLQILESLKEF